jgi:hypothetical protein
LPGRRGVGLKGFMRRKNKVGCGGPARPACGREKTEVGGPAASELAQHRWKFYNDFPNFLILFKTKTNSNLNEFYSKLKTKAQTLQNKMQAA